MEQMPYFKLRCNFGRQPLFCLVPSHLLDSIDPNPVEQKQYILRNPIHRETQSSAPISRHYINTEIIECVTRGVNHAEGGWPKDIPFYDEESTARYRRRIERDDEYVDAILSVSPKLEHLLNQNNAINLYQHYFKGIPKLKPIENPVVNLNNVYKDPFKEQYNRPVACIDWTIEDNSKMVVAYCNKKYPIQGSINVEVFCYIWDLKEAIVPMHGFLPPSACWQIACSPTSPDLIVSGLEDGRVCIFDIRANTTPVAISQMHLAHRDPVTSLLYLQSRLNTEFFSGSTDGKCMWYDIRDMSEPIDSLIMEISLPPGKELNMANAEPVSVLQYERLFPTRFFCGTDTGLVINVNRKGKSHIEKMSGIYNAHKGPIKALHRNPFISKMFITCGDWTVHIWSEDIKSSPIMTGTSQRYQIQDVLWAPSKISGYMSVGADGKFRYWDMLRNIREPIIVLPLTKHHQLLKLKANHEGSLVAIGDDEGNVYLLSLSDNLVISGDKDKQIMTEKYDRETRREYILESRIKEIRLKAKMGKDQGTDVIDIEPDIDAQIKTTEDEYRRAVMEEIKRSGIPERQK